LCVVALSLPCCALAAASAPPHLWLDVTAQDRQGDALSVEDVRPAAHGSVGGTVAIGLAVTPRWLVATRGGFGGSWFDFGPFGFDSNVEDFGWRVAVTGEHRWPVGSSTRVEAGLGFECGEYRSWYGYPILPSTGPRSFERGGVLRVGVSHAVASRLELVAGVSPSVFIAEAWHPTTGEQFRWLGRAACLELGLRAVVLRSR
jgi:hypothetical protein